MKKILWISIALALTGCGKQAQAETTPTTTVTQQTSVSKELAEQASKEIEELTRLEAESQIQYSEESGDIINPEQEKQNEDMMNVIRQEVIDGDIKGQEIDEEVDMWCDFLSTSEKAEFKSELHLLEQSDTKVEGSQSHETHSQQTKAAETKSHNVSKPAETQPAPQQTETETQAPSVTPQSQQTEPVYQEPAPQPENNNTSGEIDTSGWNMGGGSVEHKPLDSDQSLSPEQNEKINNAQWN